MLCTSRLHYGVTLKAVAGVPIRAGNGAGAAGILTSLWRNLYTRERIRTADMATGGGKDADIVSRIGKNIVQNVKTKEVAACMQRTSLRWRSLCTQYVT